MNTFKRILYQLLTWPSSIVPLGLLVLLKLCKQGEFEFQQRGLFVLRGYPDAWLAKHWHFSTTFSAQCIYLDPFASDISFQHEVKHTSQAAGASMAWALTVLIAAGHGHWIVHTLCLWPLCWALAYLGATIRAVLAGEHAYLGNEYEQQAYALSNKLGDQPRESALTALGDKWLADADRYANARVLSEEHDYDSKTDGIIQTFGICSFELREAMRKRRTM